MHGALYDRLGAGYSSARHPDPRIAAAIQRALGNSESVRNVGAGTGAYEPNDRSVTAVEPSAVMIAQRPASATRVMQASAEELPFADNSFDAVMALMSDHHWTDRNQGLREMHRVARHRVLVFNVDPGEAERLWLNNEYLPEAFDTLPDAYRRPGAWRESFEQALGEVELLPVPVPHDCSDGFYQAYWRRPAAYLDEQVRAATSVFAKVPEHAVTRAVADLRTDLESGKWHTRHHDLVTLGELDVGHRIVKCEI